MKIKVAVEVDHEVDLDDHLDKDEVQALAEEWGFKVVDEDDLEDDSNLSLVNSMKLESFRQKFKMIPTADLDEFLDKYKENDY